MLIGFGLIRVFQGVLLWGVDKVASIDPAAKAETQRTLDDVMRDLGKGPGAFSTQDAQKLLTSPLSSYEPTDEIRALAAQQRVDTARRQATIARRKVRDARILRVIETYPRLAQVLRLERLLKK